MSKKAVSVWNDVLVALLSTYNISLEKVDGMSSAFAKEGLSDPMQLAKMSYEEVHDALCRAGYNRGKLMSIFVPRVMALGQFFHSFGTDKAETLLKGSDKETLLKGSDKEAIEKILLQVNGMGPKAVETYFLLRGLD